MQLAEIKAVLLSGSFDALLGVVEDEWIDFKDQPYQLTTESQKYSLLEDVVSFANHEGGMLLLGCRTVRANVEGDVVSQIRPIPRDKLDFDTYRSLLNQHVHPQLKGISFSFFPSGLDPDVGLAAIEIPSASDADRPHLIAHIVNDESGKRITTKYGLVVRTGSRNSPYPVQSIHGLIKIGSSVGSLEDSVRSIQQQLNSLSLQAERAVRGTIEIPLKENRASFLKELPALLREIGLSETPTLVLAAYPSERIDVRGIYDSQSPVSQAFDNPPQLREHGFDLTIARKPELIKGSIRRVCALSYKAAQLSVSGRLSVVLRADDSFLSWAMGRQPNEPIYYRSYVLAESMYIFAAYLKSIYEALPAAPAHFDLMVGLRNAFVDGMPPLLGVRRDHNLHGWSTKEPKPAPKSNLLKVVRVSSSQSTERIAFEVRAALYHRFGFGDEEIPYSSISGEGRVVTPAEILDLNRQ